jgi:hypothetical protein
MIVSKGHLLGETFNARLHYLLILSLIIDYEGLLLKRKQLILGAAEAAHRVPHFVDGRFACPLRNVLGLVECGCGNGMLHFHPALRLICLKVQR